jgi:hypothetical protein
MKTYVIESSFKFMFYPPLTQDEKKGLYEEFVYHPLRDQANSSNGELVIKEELPLIGRAIIDASEKAAHNLRLLGYYLTIKKIK